MSRSLNLSVLVKLKDMVSAPLRGLQDKLRAVGNVGRRIGLIGALVAGVSFTQPIQAAAAYDAQLRDIAITAGRTGAAVEQSIKEQGVAYQKMALEVGQRSSKIAEAGQLLVAAGMDEALIQKLLPVIGRVSTAAGAAMTDTAKTAFALSNNLKIPAEEMELALAKLVTAGKLGRFEFKNMASEFPELTANLAKFGFTGQKAVEFLGAGLQVAMFGTDDPKTAANNMKNFLGKVLAPDAIKNFKKEFKVDIVKVMQDATAKGINPVEAVIQKILKATGIGKKEIDAIYKKAKAGGATDAEAAEKVKQAIAKIGGIEKLQKLFGDVQVLDFLIPLISSMDKFAQFKEDIAKSTPKQIWDDFASRLNGLQANLDRFSELGDQALRRVGQAFAKNLHWINDFFDKLMSWVDEADQKFPGLVDQILTIAGAALLVGSAIAILTPIFTGLTVAIGVVVSAFGFLGGIILAMTWPVWAVVALLAGAAFLIIKNWGTFAPFFKEMWQGVKDVFSGAWTFLKGLFNGDSAGMQAGFEKAMGGLGKIAGAIWEVVKALARIVMAEIKSLAEQGWEALKAKGEEAWTWAKGLPGRIGSAIGEAASDAGKWGAKLMEDLRTEMETKFAEAVAWAKEVPGRIGSAIGEAASDAGKWGAKLMEDLRAEMETKFAEAVAWAKEVPGRIGSSIGEAASSLGEWGAKLIAELQSGVEKRFDEFIKWCRDIPNRIAAAIGEIKLPSVVSNAGNVGAPSGTPGQPGAVVRDEYGNEIKPIPAPQKQSSANDNTKGFDGTTIGGTKGFASSLPAEKKEVTVAGKVVVSATEGSRIVNVQSQNPAVPIVPDRGTVVGRS